MCFDIGLDYLAKLGIYRIQLLATNGLAFSISANK